MSSLIAAMSHVPFHRRRRREISGIYLCRAHHSAVSGIPRRRRQENQLNNKSISLVRVTELRATSQIKWRRYIHGDNDERTSDETMCCRVFSVDLK